MTDSRLFNGAVETGLRALVLLVEASPDALDLQRLVSFDYLLIHSGDVSGGPPSLHPPSPLRAGEVTVRRGLLEQGLQLYRGRGLVKQVLSPAGIRYVAEESAATFLDALRSSYATALRIRSQWLFEALGSLTEDALSGVLTDSLGRWRAEFATLSLDGESE
jgi:hypothetical protein